KLGVRPGSFFHVTECFGPVLGLMRAENVDEAIQLANGTPYGLTSGIQSLDDREITHWADRIEAGNLYVNRPITGAMVGRQPFGGWKASSVGPGAKVGGPNYVLQFARWRGLLVGSGPATPSGRLALQQVILAALTCGAPVRVSLSRGDAWPWLSEHVAVAAATESEADLIECLRASSTEGGIERLRVLDPV